MEEKKLSGSEYFARLFKEYGTTHLFYQEAMMRLTTMEAAKYGIKPIRANSENAVGYMADGYARISGKPGIAIAQAVGAANLVGGVQDAWFATSPVIAITGKKLPSYQYKNCYQECDHKALFSGVTKFSAEMTDYQQLPFLVRQAYREAVTGKPRPVHLDLLGFTGIDFELSQIDEAFFAEPMYGIYPAFRTPAETALVKKAAELIDNAERPVIVAGRGAFVSGAGIAIHDLAVKCDIPVVTTPDGKTVIDEDDPLWAGIVGNYGMDCANKAVKAADLVIFIGTQTADQTTIDWAVPCQTVKAIQIDVEPGELGKNYPDSVGLLGDAKTVVGQLIAVVQNNERSDWRKQVSDLVKDTCDRQQAAMDTTASPIRTEYLCKVLSQCLPHDAVLVADTGYSAIWTSTMVRMKSTQRYLRAAGSLGWSYPASLGVKCGAPGRPVICFTGDGGFYYHLSEMETAMRCGINTVTIVNNNSILGQCAHYMRDLCFSDEDGGLAKISFEKLNFAKIAENFGLFAIRAEQASDIAPAIEKALMIGKPALVEVVTADPDTSIPLPAL